MYIHIYTHHANIFADIGLKICRGLGTQRCLSRTRKTVGSNSLTASSCSCRSNDEGGWSEVLQNDGIPPPLLLFLISEREKAREGEMYVREHKALDHTLCTYVIYLAGLHICNEYGCNLYMYMRVGLDVYICVRLITQTVSPLQTLGA